MSTKKRKESSIRSARCEEHIRKHEKCPYDCPRRTRCEFHARQLQPCPPGCEIRQKEIETASKIVTKEMVEGERKKELTTTPTVPTGNPRPHQATEQSQSPFLHSQRKTQQTPPNQKLRSSSVIFPAYVGKNAPKALQPRVRGDYPYVEFLNEQKKEKKEKKEQPKLDDNSDGLIPVRLDISYGQFNVVDTFIWSLHESKISPEEFAYQLCVDLDYPEMLQPYVAGSIRRQIAEYADIQKKFNERLKELRKKGPTELLFLIRIDLTLQGTTILDQFEWDIGAVNQSSPEVFARGLCLDLGLTREFEVSIAHSIREQIYFYKSAYALGKDNLIQFYLRPKPVQHDSYASHPIRTEEELLACTPVVGNRRSILMNDRDRFGFFIPGEPPVMASPYVHMRKLLQEREDKLRETQRILSTAKNDDENMTDVTEVDGEENNQEEGSSSAKSARKSHKRKNVEEEDEEIDVVGEDDSSSAATETKKSKTSGSKKIQ